MASEDRSPPTVELFSLARHSLYERRVLMGVNIQTLQSMHQIAAPVRTASGGAVGPREAPFDGGN